MRSNPVEEFIKMCNCAECKKELLGHSMEGVRIPPSYEREHTYGMLTGRPYCRKCFMKYRSMHTRIMTFFGRDD